jgi:uncharacterized protein DUF6982/PilZ domain-containing protein
MSLASAQSREVDKVDNATEGANRRTHLRLSAEDVLWLQGVRIKYGDDVRVVDISGGGILVETSTEVSPNTTVVFEVSAAEATQLIPARVVRSSRVDYNGLTRYQTACAFKRPLSIPGIAGSQANESRAKATPSSPSSPSSAAAVGQKVIARFLDGRIVRGYTNDFNASKPHLHLTEDAAGESRKVKIAQLKALFFVREFTGDSRRVDRQEFDQRAYGRKVEVTFSDGEILLGTTMGFKSPEHPFFVQPADGASNNLRVFVTPAAARQVRFL